MATNNRQNTVVTTTTGDPRQDASTWFAPFDPATFLSLQAAIGNRAVGQLLQAEAAQHAHKDNGDLHSETLDSARPLIVDDEAVELQAGQMRKTDFLNRLKISVCGAAEEVFQNTMWSAMGCPYIERWFSHYQNESSRHIERALRRYAPQATRVNDACEYIAIVTERVRGGLLQWAETGEMTGVTEEFRQGVTLKGLVSGALSGIASAIRIARGSVRRK